MAHSAHVAESHNFTPLQDACTCLFSGSDPPQDTWDCLPSISHALTAFASRFTGMMLGIPSIDSGRVYAHNYTCTSPALINGILGSPCHSEGQMLGDKKECATETVGHTLMGPACGCEHGAVGIRTLRVYVCRVGVCGVFLVSNLFLNSLVFQMEWEVGMSL